MVQYFVTGISTEVGKTIVSAILVEALKAHYWKPIQSGELDNSDSLKIERLTSEGTILKEYIRLNEPLSPHASAAIDNVQIPALIDLPQIQENLIVEGAGGLLVPLNNDGTTLIDYLESWKLPTVIVSRHYLGSINHTLLTVEALKNRNIPIHGIIFVGDENRDTEQIIEKISGVKIITRIPLTTTVDKAFVQEQAKKIADKI